MLKDTFVFLSLLSSVIFVLYCWYAFPVFFSWWLINCFSITYTRIFLNRSDAAEFLVCTTVCCFDWKFTPQCWMVSEIKTMHTNGETSNCSQDMIEYPGGGSLLPASSQDGAVVLCILSVTCCCTGNAQREQLTDGHAHKHYSLTVPTCSTVWTVHMYHTVCSVRPIDQPVLTGTVRTNQ